jgi:hypothetical protein
MAGALVTSKIQPSLDTDDFKLKRRYYLDFISLFEYRF